VHACEFLIVPKDEEHVDKGQEGEKVDCSVVYLKVDRQKEFNKALNLTTEQPS
jgi:hypothetical protein